MESIEATGRYLFHSTDPTAIYLEKGLEMVVATGRLWNNARGNSTGSFMRIGIERGICQALKRILTWVSQHSTGATMVDQANETIDQDYLYVCTYFARSDCRFTNIVDSIIKQQQQTSNGSGSGKVMIS
jgi:hypothetical protein